MLFFHRQTIFLQIKQLTEGIFILSSNINKYIYFLYFSYTREHCLCGNLFNVIEKAAKEEDRKSLEQKSFWQEQILPSPEC